jgi:hypothetical protein
MSLRPNANMLRFLERHVPADLAAIRKANPDDYELLHARAVFDANPVGVPTDSTLSPSKRKSVLQLTRRYAMEAAQSVVAALVQIDRRLRTCQRAKLAGGAVAAVAGAIVALLQGLHYTQQTVAVGTAALGSAGGLVTLLAGAFERTPDGLRLTAADYQLLVNHRAELVGIQRRVDADALFPLPDGELIKLYNRSNEIADDLSKLTP